MMITPRNILSALSGLCALLLLCAYPAAVQAQGNPTQWVLLDRSGSMRGFFATDQMSRLEGLVRGSDPGNVKSYYFIDQQVVGIDGVEEFGNQTLLNNALRYVLSASPQPHIVWFVTDNQPSGSGATESDRDLTAFYTSLRSDRVKRLCFFPLKLPFDGDLYTLEDSLLSSYRGKRGLLVYALLLDEAFTEQYEKSVAAFEKSADRSFAEHSPVRRVSIKPLESETITAKLTSLTGSKFKVEGNTVVGTDFSEGQAIEGTFGIELNSNFGLIKIDEAEIEAKEGEFKTRDFSTPNPKADIDPKVFREFQPGKPPPPFLVTLRLEPMQVESTLSSILNSLGRKRGDITGHIYISISVPPTKFSPVEGLNSEFSTDKNIFSDPSPGTQERIYKIGELMRQMFPNEVQKIKPRINDNSEGRIPVRLSVRYLSGWRAAYLIIPALLLLAVPFLLLWLRRRVKGAKYRLSWNQEQYRPCSDFSLTPLVGRQDVEIDRIVVASIKKTLSGIHISAQPGYVVDKESRQQLSESGSYFSIVRRSDDRSVDFRFWQVNASGENGRSSTDPDSYGDSDYGAEYSSGLHATAADPTPPPIVMPTFGTSRGPDASPDGHSSSSTSLDDLYE